MLNGSATFRPSRRVMLHMRSLYSFAKSLAWRSNRSSNSSVALATAASCSASIRRVSASSWVPSAYAAKRSMSSPSPPSASPTRTRK